jgi:hypothetical protein
MDTRKAFLSTSKTLMHAMHELSSYRIVGSTSILAILSVNLRDRDLYKDNTTPAIKDIRSISASEYQGFHLLFNESSIVLAYSWLDTYLSEVEETMFLHDPTSLGESVEIKLGKVLSCASLDELIHDLARRRARERGQWGLKNRVSELKKRHDFEITVSDSDLEWMSEFRNNLIHNRRIGSFKTSKGKVQYTEATRRDGQAHDDIKRFLRLSFTLLGQLYTTCADHLGITRRFAQHRHNMDLIGRFAGLWS